MKYFICSIFFYSIVFAQPIPEKIKKDIDWSFYLIGYKQKEIEKNIESTKGDLEASIKTQVERLKWKIGKEKEFIKSLISKYGYDRPTEKRIWEYWNRKYKVIHIRLISFVSTVSHKKTCEKTNKKFLDILKIIKKNDQNMIKSSDKEFSLKLKKFLQNHRKHAFEELKKVIKQFGSNEKILNSFMNDTISSLKKDLKQFLKDNKKYPSKTYKKLLKKIDGKKISGISDYKTLIKESKLTKIEKHIKDLNDKLMYKLYKKTKELNGNELLKLYEKHRKTFFKELAKIKTIKKKKVIRDLIHDIYVVDWEQKKYSLITDTVSKEDQKEFYQFTYTYILVCNSILKTIYNKLRKYKEYPTSFYKEDFLGDLSAAKNIYKWELKKKKSSTEKLKEAEAIIKKMSIIIKRNFYKVEENISE